MIKKICEFTRDIPYLGPILEPKPKVAVIRMAGVIADSSMIRRAGINHQKFSKLVEHAFEMMNVKALALVINSPGGSPAQCSLISSQIRALSEEKDIPVYAFVEDVAASGGYWLSCCGDKIYAQNSSIVGSIGVISAGFGLDEFIQKYEIKRRIHTSGKDKSFLDPFKPERAEDVARLKELQSAIHEDFKIWVKERRGEKLKGSDEDLMEGAFWTGADAKEKGLVDGIGDVTSVMKEKFGEEIKFVNLTPEKKWFSSLPLMGEEVRADLVYDALNIAEERAYWARFGF